jgi:hypothetical protein
MFTHLEKQFSEFLKKNIDRPDAEFYIPFAMNEVIRSGQAKVKALHTDEKWFGVTYKEDKPLVMNSLRKLVEKGVYPVDLWA